MADIFVDFGFDFYSTPTTANATSLIYTSSNSRFVINGTGFTYGTDGQPTAGAVTSVQLQTTTGVVLVSLTNVQTTMAEFGALASQILALHTQITWFNLYDDQVEPLLFTPTLIRLSNTDGSFTDVVGTGLSQVNDTLSGTVTAIRHVAANGTTVITDVPVSSVTLSIAAAAISPDLAGENLVLLLNAGNNTLTALNNNVVVGSDVIMTDLSDGPGNDIINGLGGFTRLDYRYAATGVTVDLITNTATGPLSGTDTLTNINNLSGGAGNDTFLGNGSGNFLFGDEGNDTLVGRGGDDGLDGGEGNDILYGGPGNDYMNGGNGIDTVAYIGWPSAVTVNLSIVGSQNTSSAGFDTLVNIENLIGTGLNDTLAGDAAVNRLEGGAGDDWLNGLGGGDILIGNAGNDLFIVDNAGDVVTELASEGEDAVFSTVSYDLPANVEQLWFLSGTGLVGNGNGLNNTIRGSWLGTNTLNGLDGNDNIAGGTLYDEIRGGEGDDWLGGFGGGDALYGDNGLDSLVGYEGNDYLFGGEGTGILVGIEGDDFIFGGSVYDYMVGGAGADHLEGYGGDDYYILDDALDTLVEVEGGGRDTVWTSATWTLGTNFEDIFLLGAEAIDATGNAVANVIRGNDAANTLRGMDGDDDMGGGGGADSLEGGAGADYMNGGDGADVLVGGAGADTLVGGAGNDRFVLSAVGDSTTASTDGIYDFVKGSDLIDISGLHTGVSDTFAFVEANGSSRLNIDVGGNGSVDAAIDIVGVIGLTAEDVIWIAPPSAPLIVDEHGGLWT